jgi:hypothetical protein
VAPPENWKTNTGSNKTWLQCVFLVQFLDVAQVVIVYEVHLAKFGDIQNLKHPFIFWTILLKKIPRLLGDFVF